MEASITILIALVVLFAFTLPALLRRTERAAAQRELNEVPETAEICQPPAAEPCTAEPARPELFTASTPAVRFAPPPAVDVVSEPAQLSLRRPAPTLSIIDGGAEPVDAVQAPAAEPECIELPVAVGETLSLTQLHSAAQTMTPRDRRPFNPLDATMTNTTEAGPTTSHRGRPAAMPAHLRRHLDSARPAGTRAAGAAAGARISGPGSAGPVGGPGSHRSRGGAPADRAARPAGRPAAPVDAKTAEKIAGIRSVIPMISVVFLGMLAAALVTAVLAAFSVLPWAVPLLAAVLAGGAVLLVGELNKRVRALRKEAASPVAEAPRAYETAQASEARQTREAVQARADVEAEATAQSDAERPAPAAARAPRPSAQARRFPRHIIDVDAAQPESPASETESTAAEAAAKDTAQPAAEESAPEAETAAVEDPPASEATEDTSGEDYAAETDTSVTISRTTPESLSLSFGPKPRAAEDSADAAATTAEAADDAEADAEIADDAEAGADAEATDTSAVADPFAQRLQATGWKPNPLPKPTYVDAPVVAREQPEPVVADASSFTLEPQSRESLAEMFAAELGYRPELEDAARDDDAAGPLSHGRTAIRFKATGTDSGAGVASIDDVLARRRA